MSFLKSKLNLLNIAVVATTLSFVPALAQANPPVEGEVEMTPAEPSSGGFDGSDLNGDGSLDMSEFMLYAGDQAVAGDADFTAIVSSGDYETAFKLMDADANGSLSEDEVTGGSDGLEDEDMMPEGETETESDY